MDYKKGLCRILEDCGRDTTVCLGAQGEFTDKAIIQLMRYKNKMYIDLPVGELGMHDNGSYLYIGKPDYDFSQSWESVRVVSEGNVFLVKRAQMIYCGGRPFYIWAVLYPAVKGGEYERV